MLEFREDLTVGRITIVMSCDDKDISSYMTESSQSLLELATGVEVCNIILEEHGDELKEAQRRTSDENDDPPSKEEFQMVREKWKATVEVAHRLIDKWKVLKDEMQGPEDKD